MGFVDDTQNYGAGARHLPVIIRKFGPRLTTRGAGFSWPKFSAYATDWYAFIAGPLALEAGITPDGISVERWDIWKGVTIKATVPRADADTTEKLLGNGDASATDTPCRRKTPRPPVAYYVTRSLPAEPLGTK